MPAARTSKPKAGVVPAKPKRSKRLVPVPGSPGYFVVPSGSELEMGPLPEGRWHKSKSRAESAAVALATRTGEGVLVVQVVSKVIPWHQEAGSPSAPAAHQRPVSPGTPRDFGAPRSVPRKSAKERVLSALPRAYVTTWPAVDRKHRVVDPDQGVIGLGANALAAWGDASRRLREQAKKTLASKA